MHVEGCNSQVSSVHVPDNNKFQDLFLPELGDKPNHPKTIMLLKQKFGDKKPMYRSFQSLWFEKWPWIMYNETDDKAFCFVYIAAIQQGRVRNCMLTSKTSDAFLTRGFTNRKDATGEKHGGFLLHERSHVAKCLLLFTNGNKVALLNSAQI